LQGNDKKLKREEKMKKVVVPLADGVEEMEAVIIIDVLRRAGWEVTGAAVKRDCAPAQLVVKGSRGVKILADTSWYLIEQDVFDILVLPGGSEGTQRLMSESSVLDAIRKFVQQGKIVGAICAAPLVLQEAGVLSGRRATCHPSLWHKLSSAVLNKDRVVADGKILTSQGPGTAMEFALEIIKLVEGQKRFEAVAVPMVIK